MSASQIGQLGGFGAVDFPYRVDQGDFFIYADSTNGNDLSSGKFPQAPVRSFGAAWQRLPREYAGPGTRVRFIDVTPGGGTFVLPDVAAKQNFLRVPARLDSSAEYVGLIGQFKDALLLGARSISATGTTTFAGATLITVTDGAGGLAVHGLRGGRLRTTNLASNRAITILDNTATVITLATTALGLLANGTTFVVEFPATSILTPTSALGMVSSGFDGMNQGCLASYGVRFSTVLNMDFTFNRMTFNMCGELDGKAGAARFRFNSVKGNWTSAMGQATFPFDGRDPENVVLSNVTVDDNGQEGSWIHDIPMSSDGIALGGDETEIVMSCMALKNGTLGISGGAKLLITRSGIAQPTSAGGALVAVGEDSVPPASLLASGVRIEPFNAAQAIIVSGPASVAQLNNIEVLNTYGQAVDGLTARRGANFSVTGATGNGVSGNGLVVAAGGTGTNGGSNTIAGAGAVKIGANAAVSWALNNAGLAANVTDAANASPQGCWFGPQ